MVAKDTSGSCLELEPLSASDGARYFLADDVFPEIDDSGQIGLTPRASVWRFSLLFPIRVLTKSESMASYF
jgi:hypothetical protein